MGGVGSGPQKGGGFKIPSPEDVAKHNAGKAKATTTQKTQKFVREKAVGSKAAAKPTKTGIPGGRKLTSGGSGSSLKGFKL